MRRRAVLLGLLGAFAAPLRAAPVLLGAEARLRLDAPAGLAREAEAAAWAEAARLDAVLSLYRPDSQLARLNAAGRLDRPDPALLACLRLAGRVHAATGGRFDPTVQPLWRAHAAGGDVGRARGLVGWDRVRVTDDVVTLAPGQALTLNGIAQGVVADRVAALLADRGITRALVDMGEQRALGGPFRLGIEDPEGRLWGQVTLHQGACATSSPSAMVLPDGAAHILGPRGEAPLWATVTATHASAAVADALATAAVLMGAEEARAAARTLGAGLRVVSAAGELATL